LDVSQNKIAVGTLRWDEQVPDAEMLFNIEPSVRRLINRFDDPGRLRSVIGPDTQARWTPFAQLASAPCAARRSA
jgi:hypothetical protein